MTEDGLGHRGAALGRRRPPGGAVPRRGPGPGAGQLFADTTNLPLSTGDGIAPSRAGAVLADLEFVQFHPTALHVDGDPRPLISEAMRGEGAVLRDGGGAPVMAGASLGDLGPRDVVTRAAAACMAATGARHLWLDATAIPAAQLEHRFPTILGPLPDR